MSGVGLLHFKLAASDLLSLDVQIYRIRTGRPVPGIFPAQAQSVVGCWPMAQPVGFQGILSKLGAVGAKEHPRNAKVYPTPRLAELGYRIC